jgi:MOSC domain-containing protein YiiM
VRVVSVNVGRPVPLRVAGEVVPSAIGKQQVAGSVAVGVTNLAGDEQGDKVNHGGPEQAVYAYAAEDAAWWGAQLGRELAPGTFGENLTLEGVDVNGARIGERWQVGTAELRVAGPRVPCQKLATQIGDTAFVKRFTLALRPGAYLAVTREGELQAGDELQVVHRPAHDVSVALALEVLLLAPHRLAELEPARPDMLSKLAGWVDERARSRAARGAA